MKMSKEIVAAIIGGVCIVLAAIIGVSYQFSNTKKENIQLKAKLNQKMEDLDVFYKRFTKNEIEITKIKDKLQSAIEERDNI